MSFGDFLVLLSFGGRWSLSMHGQVYDVTGHEVSAGDVHSDLVWFFLAVYEYLVLSVVIGIATWVGQRLSDDRSLETDRTGGSS